VIVRRDQSLMLREGDKGRADERAVSSAQLVARCRSCRRKAPTAGGDLRGQDVRYERS